MPQTTNINTESKETLATMRAIIPDRRLTSSEARQLTERQATRLRGMLDNSEPKLDLDHLAELRHISLVEQPELPTSATSFWNGSQWLILVKTTETITRQRFSICHELHHIICHPQRQQLFGTLEVRNPEAEYLADYFAACLLMPRLLVKRHWGIGPRRVTAMAARFGVSPQAMSYRLDQLGLTEPHPRCAWSNPTTDDLALETT